MIQFERSFDYGLVRGILTHPKIWPHISDDGSPPVDEYQPVQSEAVWYVLVRDDDEILGLWMLHPHNFICWEIHTCLLPHAWGHRARAAALMLPIWIWANTTCRRIITNVPSTNRLALHFAISAGMTMYGVNRASYLKSGVLCDQICLGICAPEEIPAGEAETAREAQEVSTMPLRQGEA